MIHSQPRPPYQTRVLASTGGAIYKGVAYCAMLQLLTLGANSRTLKFRFFAIRVYYEKLGLILKPLVPNFRPDLFAHLRDIAEKQVSANLKPIVVARISNSQEGHQVTRRVPNTHEGTGSGQESAEWGLEGARKADKCFVLDLYHAYFWPPNATSGYFWQIEAI